MTPDRGPRVAVVGLHLEHPERVASASLNGTWPASSDAIAGAQRAGAHIVIVQAAWADEERELGGVPCHLVREDRPPFITLPGGRRLRRRPDRLLARVAALKPDVIHFEGLLFPRGLRALAAALPGVPILAQDHGTKCPRGWRRWWYRWGFAPLGGVAFTARAQAEPFVAAGILAPDLPVFEVVELSSAFTPGDQQFARSVAGMHGDPCLLWAGNLDANKDPLTVLAAVEHVAADLPNIRLDMCFRYAPLLETVKARIASVPSLAARVRLRGPVPHAEIEMHYRAADFLVQASHVEGSGGALIDALACGTTPLVTDIPSFRRITGEGACGALVPVGDAGALAAAIRQWAGRDRHALRRRAREHFESVLSFDAIGRQLYAAYVALR